MFHLFKKVYLDFDDKINMGVDRVICSQENGGNKIAPDLDKYFYGEQIATAKTVQELTTECFGSSLELFEKLNEKTDAQNKRVIVYCDKESYYRLSIHWMKVILPYSDVETAWKFFKSHIFKEKNFVNSRLSASGTFAYNADEWLVDQAIFEEYWEGCDVTEETRKEYSEFLKTVVTSLKVEFLLAGYLFDKRYGEELAKVISPLVKKDLEKFIYEHKEILLVHFQSPVFQKLLGCVLGPYTFDNFYDMVKDPNPYCELMFRPEIWGDTRTSMYAPSSGGTINLSAFSEEDIQRLKEYSVITGQVWSDELWYTQQKVNSNFKALELKDYKERFEFVVTSNENTDYYQTFLRSEIDKFEFIKMFKDKEYLTVEELDKILAYEIYHQYHAAGTFYAIDLRSVNTYFVDFILQNYNNKEKLQPYIFEIVE